MAFPNSAINRTFNEDTAVDGQGDTQKFRFTNANLQFDRRGLWRGGNCSHKIKKKMTKKQSSTLIDNKTFKPRVLMLLDRWVRNFVRDSNDPCEATMWASIW